MTFPKLNSSVSGIFISPGGIFFLAQFLFLGPAGTGNLFGTKICGERSVCPMVTKLSGFGQYLGRNLMKVENLDFGHGIVLFWYWEPFWDQIFGAAYLVLMTFPKLNSSVSGIFRVIPRWYFFFWPNFDFWALQVLETFLGPKFAERDPFVQW